jgi:hypothetical protein
VILLDVILSLSSYLPKISIIFWTIGLTVLAIGIVLLVLDRKGHGFGGRWFRY